MNEQPDLPSFIEVLKRLNSFATDVFSSMNDANEVIKRSPDLNENGRVFTLLSQIAANAAWSPAFSVMFMTNCLFTLACVMYVMGVRVGRMTSTKLEFIVVEDDESST